MKKIQIIVGSTRDNRKALKIAKWIKMKSESIDSIDFDITDLKDWNLPNYNEPGSPMMSKSYKHELTTKWSEHIGSSDGFIFVTPEYNGFFTGALKDAIDYLYHEWAFKPYGIVGYGSRGAKRAVKQLHLLLSSFKMKNISEDIGIVEVWDAFNGDGLDEGKVDGVINDLLKSFIMK